MRARMCMRMHVYNYFYLSNSLTLFVSLLLYIYLSFQHTHTHIRVSMSIYMHVRMYVCASTCTHAHTYIYIYITYYKQTHYIQTPLTQMNKPKPLRPNAVLHLHRTWNLPIRSSKFAIPVLNRKHAITVHPTRRLNRGNRFCLRKSI